MEEPSILQFLTPEGGSSKKGINRRQKARVTGKKEEDWGGLRRAQGITHWRNETFAI